jgi:regulator of protease activity HflC (stomatin/prohibitin superfamily)
LYRVVDAAKSVIALPDAPAADYQLTRRGLGNTIGQRGLDAVPPERSKIDDMPLDGIDSSAESWSLRVKRNVRQHGVRHEYP